MHILWKATLSGKVVSVLLSNVFEQVLSRFIMQAQLTHGAVSQLLNNVQLDKPVLQVVTIKEVGDGTRYRLVLSDGTHSGSNFMVATQMTDRVKHGEVVPNAIIQLDKIIINAIPNRTEQKLVIIVLDFTVLAKPSVVIGTPVGIGPGSDPPPAPPTSVQRNERDNPTSGQSRNSSMPSSTRSSSSTSQYAGRTFPINSLTPYQNRWAICARVANKSSIRKWSNSKGKLFSATFLDKTGEIRGTAFNDECDKIYPLLELNKVYYISNADLKTANKQYTSVKHDYEITFHKDSVIELCESEEDLPKLQFDFVQILNLQNQAKDTIVDVLGVCRSFGDCHTLTLRTTNRAVKKRDVFLVDKSNAEITLTMWNDDAEKFDGTNHPIIAVKGARVSDFGGCSLSLLPSSTLYINPDLEETFSLRTWFDDGLSVDIQSLSIRTGGSFTGGNEWKCLAQVELESLGQNDKPDYFTCKATVVLVRKENFIYKACATCNKKVLDHDGYYRCEKCNTESPEFKWRLLLQMTIADCSGSLWVTCFQEQAELILGKSADIVGDMQSNDEEQVQELITDATFSSFVFKLRTKMENFNDENRIKTTVVSVCPVAYVDYGNKLLGDLTK